VFEKAGVNFSDVHGNMSADFAAQVPGEGTAFTAAGISLVLHPQNPYVPTVHMNFRYLTKGEKSWFGGGADLTPYYPFRADVIHFHRAWKSVCERFSPQVDYRKLKKACDQYFFLPHRNEARGVGGIFFDYLENDWQKDLNLFATRGKLFCQPTFPSSSAGVGLPMANASEPFKSTGADGTSNSI